MLLENDELYCKEALSWLSAEDVIKKLKFNWIKNGLKNKNFEIATRTF